MFDRYYCINVKTFATFRVISCTILFRLFTDVLRTQFSTDYPSSRAGHYTSRGGINSVAPLQVYCKLRSRALTARELPC